MTGSLTEFLQARIDEDEAAAMGASHHSHMVHDYERDNYGFLWVKTTRLLAECEVKRRIVERALGPVSHAGQDIERQAVLRDHAAVYADHPDYREEWAPVTRR